MVRRRITARIVDTKRHTIGYIVDNNKRATRGEVVKMARRNQLVGVVAKNGVAGWYVSGTPSHGKLEDLPTIVR